MAEILFSFQRMIKLPLTVPGNIGYKYQAVHSAEEYWHLLPVVKALSDFYWVNNWSDSTFIEDRAREQGLFLILARKPCGLTKDIYSIWPSLNL